MASTGVVMPEPVLEAYQESGKISAGGAAFFEYRIISFAVSTVQTDVFDRVTLIAILTCPVRLTPALRAMRKQRSA